MSDPASSPATFREEVTFRSFTSQEGANYAQNRRTYSPKFYQLLVDHHTSTGGQLDTLLDVGCGPGTAVRGLAPRFTHAIGLDPSEGMINTARSLGGVSGNSQPIRFDISTAEDLGEHLSPPIPISSVDLITAATAAHWFDMSSFWPRAARLLKPGGSVALWTSSSMLVHPSVPNYAAIQAAIDKVEELLADYMAPGNRIAQNLYVDLPLPWMQKIPVLEFDEDTFLRKEWNTGGISEPGDESYAPQGPVDLDTLEKVLGTTSPVARWRESHPDAVDTDRDVVRVMRNEIELLLHEAGVKKGNELLSGGVAGVLLVVKKKA